MATPFDWKIDDIERTANEAKRRLYELDSLRSDVGNLEHSLREARAETYGLRDELRSTQDRLNQLESQMQEILEANADVLARGESATLTTPKPQ